MSVKIANDTDNGSSTLQPSNTATGDIVHTLPAFTTELAPRMQLMIAQATTSGTSIDFTGIPAWARKITVMFNGVSTNGTSSFLVQLGTIGGIENTGYLGSSAYTSTGVANTASTAGFIISTGTASTTVYGQIIITAFDTTYTTWLEQGNFSSPATSLSFYTSGAKTVSSALTRIRITTANGTDTLDAGQINIMYEG